MIGDLFQARGKSIGNQSHTAGEEGGVVVGGVGYLGSE